MGRWVKIVGVSVAIAAPVGYAVQRTYEYLTAFPREIAIAGGQPQARFVMLAGVLGEAIERDLGIRVRVVPTAGSMENLALVHQGDVEFAISLSQVGQLAAIKHPAPERANMPADLLESGAITFVAALEHQPAHFLIRRTAGIRTPADLRGRTMSLGLPGSGSHVVSLALLEHLGLDRSSLDTKELSHVQVVQAFREEKLDAAFIFGGMHAPVYRELLKTGNVELWDVPFADAFVKKHAGFEMYEIPAGMYRSEDLAAPPRPVQSVALRIHLLANAKVDPGLVEAVCRIVLSEEVMTKGNLTELFARGREFARQAPDYPMHPGARNFYEPELRPLLPADFVESTEGIRSFLVSLGVSIYLVYRWFQSRKEHKLEKYFRELLAIEKEYKDAEGAPIIAPPDGKRRLLEPRLLIDRVEGLKRDALTMFTAKEINENLAILCFVQMCDSFVDRILAGVSREKNHRLVNELSIRGA